jgi:CheY-like chemotaxis protein
MDHILVIDDEDIILDCLRKSLSYLGYLVTDAHDGQEEIELLKNGCNFDLVITDIGMPGMSGNAVAKHIRS